MSNPNIDVNVTGPTQPASIYKTVVLKGDRSFVSQVTEPNTKYVIKHNFDLSSGGVVYDGWDIEGMGGNPSIIDGEEYWLTDYESGISEPTTYNLVDDECFFVIDGHISDVKEITLQYEENAWIATKRKGYHARILSHLDTNAAVTIPENCILEFDGGSIRNGYIVGLSQIVYPEFFGAKGNGVTDDTDALAMAAYAVEHSKFEKAVFSLMAGKKYVVSSTITINKSCFDGNGSTIVSTINDKSPVISFHYKGVKNLWATNFTVDCNTKDSIGIEIEQAINFNLSHFYITNCTYIGVYMPTKDFEHSWDSYEIYVSEFNIVGAKKDSDNHLYATGIVCKTSDCRFYNGVITYMPIGMYVTWSPIITDIHIWGYPSVRQCNVGILIKDTTAKLDKVVFDTCVYIDSSKDPDEFIETTDDIIEKVYNGGTGVLCTSSQMLQTTNCILGVNNNAYSDEKGLYYITFIGSGRLQDSFLKCIANKAQKNPFLFRDATTMYQSTMTSCFNARVNAPEWIEKTKNVLTQYDRNTIFYNDSIDRVIHCGSYVYLKTNTIYIINPTNDITQNILFSMVIKSYNPYINNTIGRRYGLDNIDRLFTIKNNTNETVVKWNVDADNTFTFFRDSGNKIVGFTVNTDINAYIKYGDLYIYPFDINDITITSSNLRIIYNTYPLYEVIKLMTSGQLYKILDIESNADEYYSKSAKLSLSAEPGTQLHGEFNVVTYHGEVFVYGQNLVHTSSVVKFYKTATSVCVAFVGESTYGTASIISDDNIVRVGNISVIDSSYTEITDIKDYEGNDAYASKVGTVRPIGIVKGFCFFDETFPAKPSWWDGTMWKNADGTKIGTPTNGTFANKPTVATHNIPVGFGYFCTDKQTSEGGTDGIMIYYKGSGIWVDALGRVVS